ncbi:MAG: cyclase family protein, partial [Oscillospiraceae bacterium]
SPYWEGMPKGVVELNNVVVPFDEMNLVITTQKFPGQFGTHIDYPAHFVENGRLCGDFGIKDTVLPLVVLDVSAKCAANADYELTLEDIEEHEKKYGKIPKGSFVAMRSDWYKRWPDGAALANADPDGEHFPGWTMDTIAFLFDDREVSGIGHETLDTDAPITSGKVGDLQCERNVLARDKFQVELLANLDKVAFSPSARCFLWR